MTTFVVSLFLPYTVDFQDPDASKPPLVTAAEVEPTQLGRHGSTTSLNSVKSEHTKTEPAPSLLRQDPPRHISLPVRTPAAMMEQEDYFTPAQPSASTHFLRPNDPKSLVRSDAHVPEWDASGLFFNQPRSRAEAKPAQTILEYAKAQERAQAQREKSRERAWKAKYKGKASEKDPRWAAEFTITPALQGNGGLTNAIRAAQNAGTFTDVFTVGLIGFPTDALKEQKKDEIEQKLEEEHQALTVYVSDKNYDGHYAHYCKTILWPVFHYVIPDHPKSKAFLDHSWVFYESVNQAFADKVVKNYKRGDVIWVNDYHLCLVPAMIRQKLPDAPILFFLHAAFPSSEVFRCLATRRQLLEGMLGANLVAFQTPEYAHHFLQTCSRILAVEATEDGVQLENRFVNVWSSPIGIDPRALDSAREDKNVMEWIDTMLKRYEGKHVIVARDKLDSIRGVRQKLLGYELFLNKNPEWKEKVVLIQVATSTQEDAELSSTVSEIVTRIDASHSTLTHNPLVFLRQDIAFSQYFALLSIADGLAITSLRDGMNLTCHEFVICSDGRFSPKKHGPVILSEFTGSSSLFDGAELLINPWNYQSIADAFKVCLEMSDEEKERRYTKMRDVVMHHTGEFWVRNLSEHLHKVYQEQFQRDTMSIPRLNVPELLKNYEGAYKRLFILDYEGTLAPYGNVKKTIVTNTQIITDVLSDIASEESNIVYVMSGRMTDEVELIFNRVPNVGLICENGCMIREPGSEEWIRLPDEEKTKKWKEAILQILQYYVERVETSWVEEFECKLVFHYENAFQSESANRHAGDCANHINDASEQQRVKAVPTKKAVIVEPMDYDKSTAAKYVMDRHFPETSRPEFLFVAGNDRDDESTFKWAKQLNDDWIIRNVMTVTVGDRNTLAMSTLTTGTRGLINVLRKIAKVVVSK